MISRPNRIHAMPPRASAHHGGYASGDAEDMENEEDLMEHMVHRSYMNHHSAGNNTNTATPHNT